VSAKVVTIRSELKRSIGDFLADAQMSCAETEESLIALTVTMADYREEGRQLFPRLLICDDLDSVLRNVQGSNPIELGSGDRNPDTVLRALKKCGPLAASSWAIWIERKPNEFRFGVFRAPTATAIDLRTTLRDTVSSSPLRAVMIGQFAPGTIELISTGQEGIRIHLTGQREEQIPNDEAQRQFIEWSASDISDDRLRQSYQSFATTMLHDLLRKGHGTLIAVVPHNSKAWKRHARDAVLLEEPVDLASQLKAHAYDPTSSALSELLASVDLVEGMLNSDGITVFDTAGRVLGFNWFIRTDTSRLTPREKLGGARHRAFAALKARVDVDQVRGTFIRSSDGTDRAYERVADA
jgi:hypothetical protein